MPLRVLLIEDDPDIQRMIQLSLKFQGGHEVLTADGGAEGLAMAEQVQPDLILLDVMMPGIDGHETCRRLKAAPATQSIPVIFLSGCAQQTEIEQGRQLGAVGYLIKPFDPMTLSAQLNSLLGLTGKA